MTTSIHRHQLEHHTNNQPTQDNMSFNDLVLQHIRDNKPDGTLEQLLTEMKGLSPESPLTMHKLNSALLYSNTILRSEPDHIEYTTDFLDSRTCQLLALNMFTNFMLDNISRQYDEDDDSTLF
ncbi:hypothetical protein [Klebsiella sp. BIGb0407]|uniref:hypothetical protein n=1 Tax=Klebsiella sp. BIGb0407 TaxID=2940603 RepID=UPI0021697E30|nr:hypothetical protein [Klebsiella sp. BIGb0407]MCS3431558.1 hypothetical protein [Klebsiella sp. BIGb0407]